MKIASVAVTPPAQLAAKAQNHNELNPAKQAKAADPAVKGADFGALVSELAHARNAARFEAKHGAPPPTDPALVSEPAATEETTSSEPATPVGETTPSDAAIALNLLSGEALDISV